jgi:hypothetical protein
MALISGMHFAFLLLTLYLIHDMASGSRGARGRQTPADGITTCSSPLAAKTVARHHPPAPRRRRTPCPRHLTLKRARLTTILRNVQCPHWCSRHRFHVVLACPISGAFVIFLLQAMSTTA